MGHRKYWLSHDDNVSGPFSRQQMWSMRREGQIASHDLLRRDGTEDWRPVELAMARWRRRDRSGTILKWLTLGHLTLLTLVGMAVLALMAFKSCQKVQAAAGIRTVPQPAKLDARLGDATGKGALPAHME